MRFNQKDFLDGVIGDPKYYKTCKAMFMCDTPYARLQGLRGQVRVQLRQGQASS